MDDQHLWTKSAKSAQFSTPACQSGQPTPVLPRGRLACPATVLASRPTPLPRKTQPTQHLRYFANVDAQVIFRPTRTLTRPTNRTPSPHPSLTDPTSTPHPALADPTPPTLTPRGICATHRARTRTTFPLTTQLSMSEGSRYEEAKSRTSTGTDPSPLTNSGRGGRQRVAAR